MKPEGERQGVFTQKKGGDEKTDVGPHHEDIAVSEIDQEKHPVHQRVPEGDEGIKASPLESVKKVLEEGLKKQNSVLLIYAGTWRVLCDFGYLFVQSCT
jgi:hypothetical protein